MTSLLGLAAAGVFLYMTAAFAIALLRKDNSIADIFWGPGFGLVAVLTAVAAEAGSPRQILVNLLVLVWGMRLALHIAVRNRKRGEDFRYAKWRRDWGRLFIPRTYLQVFLLQGVFLLIISFPVLVVNHRGAGPLTGLDIFAAALWLIGFFFEAVGDFQLLRFKRNPENKGRIMTQGLWSITRHPNYFGEAVMWWAIFLFAVQAPNGWISVIGPALITFLLMRVSGVVMLEKKYTGNPEYEVYVKSVNAFFPGFRRKP
ncbi:MAG: DUF1295 domain-containing protein [Acidobacteriota bacterium]|nr:DUF1295 domain-containing protein [Acidobacteriota bacterium]